MTPMITSVTYSRLKSFGNYENATVSATADVSADGDPQIVLDGLRDWVHERLTEQAGVGELRETAFELKRNIQDLEHEVDRARTKHEHARKILAANGIEVEAFDAQLARLPF